MAGNVVRGYVSLFKNSEDFLDQLYYTEGQMIPTATKLKESVNHILKELQESSDTNLEKGKLGTNVWTTETTDLTLILEGLLPIKEYLEEIRWNISDEDIVPLIGEFIGHVEMVGKLIIRQRMEVHVKEVEGRFAYLLYPNRF